ncbi:MULTISPECIES: response regulator [unclassified Pedobacter]|uniref:response regulator n=1 Tax=Pedobacter TaxID=84567 RepID=UPI000B4BACF7|nr:MULTISPECIES: response regulator [unclassified Pedobacter]MCX2585548.1 response regulator [Pedobacter sp. MR22-3]OWK70744.1 response regulator [Pedobacter sp. AJM]
MSTPDIFYVEDDEDYAFFMQSAIKEVGDTLNIAIVEDGAKALAKLQQFAESKIKPKLILLDLNLPGLSGLDLLKFIRDIPYLKSIPVILFSTSDNPDDVKASIEFGANAYLTKPDGYDNLVKCVHSVHDFWFNKHLRMN